MPNSGELKYLYTLLMVTMSTAFLFATGFLMKLSKSSVTIYKLIEYVFKFSSNTHDIKEPQTILDDEKIYLSLVFPAYNEEKRIEKTLETTVQYLEKRRENEPNFTYEIIVVNDGSKDNTSQAVQRFYEKYSTPKDGDKAVFEEGKSELKLIEYKINRGKGFAVKIGVLRAKGKYILFLDSDGATDIRDLEKLERKMKQIQSEEKIEDKTETHGVVLGSRSHLEEKAIRERKWYRNLTMHAFHFFVYAISGIRDIRDTQCGFKLLTRHSAKSLFLNLHIDRWCFDIDMICIMKRLKFIPYAEVSVNWTEQDGSKLTFFGMAKMGIDLVLVRFFYTLRFWRLRELPTLESMFEDLINLELNNN